MKNWATMSRRRAPIASRTPISWRRSWTESSIMLSTPIPPIISVAAASTNSRPCVWSSGSLFSSLRLLQMPTASVSSAGIAEAPGQDRAHLALGLFHQVPIAQPVDDLAHHELVGPPARPVRLHGADRDPGVLVDLEAVARELRPDVREQPHHLEGLARDPHPAPEAPFDAEQAAAHLVAEHARRGGGARRPSRVMPRPAASGTPRTAIASGSSPRTSTWIARWPKATGSISHDSAPISSGSFARRRSSSTSSIVHHR